MKLKLKNFNFTFFPSGYFSIKDSKNKTIAGKCFFQVKFKYNNKIHSLTAFNSIKPCENIKIKEGKNLSINSSTDCIKISISKENICKVVFSIKELSEKQLTIKAGIKNESMQTLELEEIVLFGCEDKISCLRLASFFTRNSDFNFYKLGYQSWSPAFFSKNSSHYFKTVKIPKLPDSEKITPEEFIEILDNKHNWRFSINNKGGEKNLVQKKNKIESEWMGMLARKDLSIILGSLTFKSYFPIIEIIKKDGKTILLAKNKADLQLIKGGETISSEILFIGFSNNLEENLKNYTEKTAKLMKAEPWRNSPSGWCSWYYYFTKITQNDIFKNLNFLKQNKNKFKIKYFQLDDGYQKNIGDWLEFNSRFPEGLKRAALKIKNAGLKPGIWISPFLVSEKSNIFKKHPNWVVRNKSGHPVVAIYNWGSRNFGLDLTNPEVQEHLIKVFKKFLNYGFEYFKIDFIYAGALKGIYHNRGLTRFQAYRKGLEIIKKTVKGKLILGCGAPLGPSIGMINANRIGSDTSPYWGGDLPAYGPSAFYSAQNIILRSFMHKKWWINDPDCLMTRFEKTDLAKEQVKFLASLIYLSGGLLFISDNLPELSEDSLKLLSGILKRNEKPSTALDLVENYPPEIYFKKIKNFVELGIFNWKNKTLRKTIKLSKLGLKSDVKYSLYDILEGGNIGEAKGEINFKLHPYSAKLLQIKIYGFTHAPESHVWKGVELH